MYMLFLTISIAITSGIGFFAAYDTEHRVIYRSAETRANSDVEVREQMERSLRRQTQINPGRFPSPNPNGLVEIPRYLVQELLSDGLRVATDATYYIASNGFVVSRVPGIEDVTVVPDNTHPGKPISVGGQYNQDQRYSYDQQRQERPEDAVHVAAKIYEGNVHEVTQGVVNVSMKPGDILK